MRSTVERSLERTLTAEGAVARVLREEALTWLGIAAQHLDHASDDAEQALALDEARERMRAADAIVAHVGYAGEDAFTLTAPAKDIASLAQAALHTLDYHLDESDKSSATLREAALVAEALEGFVAQADTLREPAGA